jgi:hypothetical protein
MIAVSQSKRVVVLWLMGLRALLRLLDVFDDFLKKRPLSLL